MSDSINDTPDIGGADAPLLGKQLQATREAAGLTIEDISNRLRLSPRQVMALESDDFTVLPEAMITRGFIRNYARLLELDPEPLLEAYRAHVPSEPPRAISIPSANILISENGGRPWPVYLLGSLLVIVLLGIWLYAGEMPKKITQPSAPVSIAPPSAEVPEPMPAPALPAAERMSEPSITPAEEAAPSQENQQAPAANAVQTPGQDATASQAAAAGASSARLKLTFTETSWVSVIDGNNQEILNKTKQAGSEEVVEGKPPFKVIIGNATGSKLTYNDKPVDLGPHTRLNVARITLE